jgi:hypothetical protein
MQSARAWPPASATTWAWSIELWAVAAIGRLLRAVASALHQGAARHGSISATAGWRPVSTWGRRDPRPPASCSPHANSWATYVRNEATAAIPAVWPAVVIVPGGPERDRKNLGGRDEPPRDGLRNRLAHWDAHWSESDRPSRVVRCAEFRRGPWSYAKLVGSLLRLQPDLDQPADGLGAADPGALLFNPVIDRR